MASIQKQRNKNGSVSYRAQLHINGIRESGNFDSKVDARASALEREAQILRGEHLTKPTHSSPTPSLILRDVFDRYSREVSPTKTGVRWEQIRLDAFCRQSIASIPLDVLNASHIAQWRDERLKQVSSSTVRRELVLINHALQIAKTEWRLIDTNPCRDIRKPADAPHRKQRISDDDLNKLISTLGYVRGTVPRNHSHQIAVALEHINFHDSRREATSRLSEIFGPMELSRITGHRDLKMLMRYYEKSASELAMKMN